jgi:hypothetical protein
MDSNRRLFSLPFSFKILITCFLVTLSLGYIVALLQVFDRTHFDVAQTLLYYRGDEVGGESAVLLPQSFGSLLAVTHVHAFSQPVMLALVGALFCFTAVSEKAKTIFVIFSFGGSVVSNAAPWLIRYVARGSAVLLPLSQALMMMSFFVMFFVTLAELWGKREEEE